MNKIIVPLANRTNYTKIKPVLQYLKNKINIHIVFSSSILLEQYGYPYKDIINDGFKNCSFIDCLLINDTTEAMNKTISISMIEHTNVYSQQKPNTVLAVGDRFDMIPAVLSAKIMNIPIFHIQGGEESGSIDDTIRNIISICSSRHYVSTQKSLEKVKSITGSTNIFNFGCPAVEYISKINVGRFFNSKKLRKKYKHPINILHNENYLMLAVHPNTTTKDINMDIIIKAVLEFNMKKVVLYPNTDAFHNLITNSIRKYTNDFILIKHMPIEDFAIFMAHTRCLIGNSSAGIREAALFGTPVVNIGKRQENRERNKNIIDSECSIKDIIAAIEISLKRVKYKKHNIYFKRNSAINIAKDILNSCRKK